MDQSQRSDTVGYLRLVGADVNRLTMSLVLEKLELNHWLVDELPSLVIVIETRVREMKSFRTQYSALVGWVEDSSCLTVHY